KADSPKIYGSFFRFKGFYLKRYEKRLYLREPIKSGHVELYDPHTLLYEGTLASWKNLSSGMHKGKIARRHIDQRGTFLAHIVIELATGEFAYEKTEVYVE